MEMYNDAFLRWKELKRHSGCLSDLRPPRELRVRRLFFVVGIKIWRGNGQLLLNVSVINPNAIQSPPTHTHPQAPFYFDGISGPNIQPRAAQTHLNETRPEPVTWRYSSQENSGYSRRVVGPPATQRERERERGAGFHGNASARPLWLLLHWANTPHCSFPAGPFSPPAHCVPSHFIQPREEGGLLSEPLSKQWGEKRSCHLYSVPRRTCLFLLFLFELQAVGLSREFDVREAELIALSQRGGTHHQTLPEMFYWDY